MTIDFSFRPDSLRALLRPKVLGRLALASKIMIGATIFALLFVAAAELMLSGAKIVADVIRSSGGSSTSHTDLQPDQKQRRSNLDQLAQRNIFGPLGQTSAPVVAPKAEKPVSNVALTLLGTYVPADDAPFAIIEHSTKKQEDAFGLKDSVFGEATLVAVYSDRVEIERGGQIEVLKLEEIPGKTSNFNQGVATVGSDQFVIEEAELNKALENLPLLLTQARAVPYFKDGKAVGLRMFAIKSGSLFERIGLQNGDILKQINGQSLGDMGEAIKLFERLKSERSLSVSLERNNEARDFKYEIE